MRWAAFLTVINLKSEIYNLKSELNMATENLGILKKKPEGYEVTLERVYPHNLKKVWDALINPEKISIWFTDMKMDLVPGGKITFWFQDEARTEMYGKVLAVEPEKLLEYTWENDDASYEQARWELFEEGPKATRLVLTYGRLIEKYAFNVPAGWHIVMNDLGEFLNGKTDFPPFGGEVPEEDKKQHEALQEEYKQLYNQLSK